MSKSIDVQTAPAVELGLAQVLTEASDVREIARHAEGGDRFEMVKRYKNGDISVDDATALLGVSRSQFFRICKQARGAVNYLQVVPAKCGRKPDKIVLPYEVERMIEEMYFEHYRSCKSFAGVWDACQSEGDRRKIQRPSYYSVCRWIKQRPEKERYEMLHGKEAAIQRYEYRPGFKKTSRPLEWVQIDHTVADVLVVDSDDRTKIIGRPYLSFAICIHTRVIVGFYISFLQPSAVTVAKLLETCVLPKDELLKGWGLKTELWPTFGLPEVIHTDNAKEFVSQVFILNAKDFGIDVQQRPIGKKHFGGHIESLIGKKSMKLLHALPGTTGANTVERKKLNSEKTASVTIERLRRMIVLSIHAYHETVHSELNKRPIDFWTKYEAGGSGVRQVSVEKHKTFRYCFYPEVPNKKISPYGIELHRRIYGHPDFSAHVHEEVLVKYDPYDLSYIMVFLNDKWLKAVCVRNKLDRSNDYEYYRWQRNQKGERIGTMSPGGAQSRSQVSEEAKDEARLSAKAKKERKRNVGKADYKRENDRLDSNRPLSNEVKEKGVNERRNIVKPKPSVRAIQEKDVSNVVNIDARFKSKQPVDDGDFVIYDMDRR
ncbi:Mu transposase C-terminal domain-containing protein [Pseudomonas monteilii]|uniref:Mu transposase C-terminal domain-containing protein n=1 Tax=Pseudomonas monteilii TaxID=76759 RepID=UPI001E4BDBAB|nr:Mu transposase C-terminal domain-containing protein [Pseudomonas monteilii]MCE0876917.1 DDE-type integrase/transposase/recombinase [Pseudomonas monteilii]MCE1015690.1 DDE-type integrase/transposase/recombinase [Pseudomonas monteilii]MCE1044081.1 DDE-type integrase/transposase/recombinase [Pseudomonas monteilii]WJN85592.1 DDE-type integrase/transposase/recombinase [Pseudomonas monteilii]WJR47587.1 DDE-type integrase/transposase/recombinase [Pseudomonas monteilii]